MAKRFTDSEKYKKAFFKALPGPYKLLWDYLYHECDHAGIWEVDWEIAQIKIGRDMPVDGKTAIELFNAGEQRIDVLKDGRKWFIRSFIEFQYSCAIGDLKAENRVHSSVLSCLRKEGIKGLPSPLQGAKDKDKDKDSLSLGKSENPFFETVPAAQKEPRRILPTPANLRKAGLL